MFKISNTIAGLATLALAAVPMFAIGSAAHAAPVAVQVADLNLTSPEGAKELNRRIDIAAASFCADQKPVTGTRLSNGSCKKAVREEISMKLKASATYAAR